MQRFSKSFGRKWMIGFLGLGLMAAGGTSYAGEGANESFQARSDATPAVAANPSVVNNMLFTYKGKKVLVRLINAKDKEWVGHCVEEDSISITVQINNNFYRFFFGDIEYIESL